MQLAPFVVCPETLGPLEAADGGFWSAEAERLYAARRGMVFMAYPSEDRSMIEATMEEERQWQGTGEAAASNLEFLRASAPGAVDLINTIRPFVSSEHERPRALDLGSGNGWVSWLLAEAGYDTWLCDFEANSLATGLNLEHENLGEGKRFVTDARFAPFADESFDLVLFKEFVHHVADFRRLFTEAGRLLRVGGVMAFLEPLRSVKSTLLELRHPDTREGHHFAWPDSYLRAVRSAGLEIVFQTPNYHPEANRRALPAWLKRRAQAEISEERPGGGPAAWVQLRLLGGASLAVIARKPAPVARAPRPPMTAIDPATLVLEPEELSGYADFPAVLQEAAGRLDR